MNVEIPVAASPELPRLLVSVRDAVEATEALLGGANWIDMKEPTRGPLGAVSAADAHQIVEAVGGSAPLSAAAGELFGWPSAASRELLAVPGLSLIKLGLAGCQGLVWRSRWCAAQAEIQSEGKQLVAVAYADYKAADAPSPTDVLKLAADAACPWILIDTYDKSEGSLGAHLPPQELAAWLSKARSTSCGTAVAGRLDHEAIRRLPLDLVDVVAVRGAACDGARTSSVSRRRVAELARLLSMIGTTATARIQRVNKLAGQPEL